MNLLRRIRRFFVCRRGHSWNILAGYDNGHGGTVMRPDPPTICLRCGVWLVDDAGTLHDDDPTVSRDNVLVNARLE